MWVIGLALRWSFREGGGLTMRKAVFLDRDGTLIRNYHYGCDPERIELLEGVPEGLRLLKREGYSLVVVTNQAGIAKGFFSEAQLAEMHKRLGWLLDSLGAPVDGWYYCPHHPEGTIPRFSIRCDCRKPMPGMLLKACAEMKLELSSSWIVGDILDDVEAGKRAGTRAILLDLGTESPPDRPERTPDYVVRDLREAAEIIGSSGRRWTTSPWPARGGSRG